MRRPRPPRDSDAGGSGYPPIVIMGLGVSVGTVVACSSSLSGGRAPCSSARGAGGACDELDSKVAHQSGERDLEGPPVS